MKNNVKNLSYIFNPKSIAVIGASQIEEKVGGVVLRNLINGNYQGRIIPINPKYEQILGLKCFSKISEIKDPIDCAVICTPAETVPGIVKECASSGVKGILVLTGGFAEVGNREAELEMRRIAEENSIALIGPNCLGVLDPASGVDSIFLPMNKLQRPTKGTTSFITQSGAVGASVMDMVAHYGVGVSRFISYGNGTSLNEIDLLEFLEEDKETKQIILYIEGTKDGKRFLEVLKRVNKKKPIVILKAGKGEKSSKAAFSHTGNLAGNYLAYHAAFNQAKIIEADDLEELFDFIKIFSQPLPKSSAIGVITDGGGLGILAADAIEDNGLQIATFSEKTNKLIRAVIPKYANVNNPLDIIADASPELYKQTIEIMMNSPEVGALVIIVLFQVPAINDLIIPVLKKAALDKRKPIAVVAVGGLYVSKLRKELEKEKIPTYGSPKYAVLALKKLFNYSRFKGVLK